MLILQLSFLKFFIFYTYQLFTLSNSDSSCEHTFSDGTTFDVSPLMLSSSGQLSYYTVWDSRHTDDSAHNYTYEFNIGAPVINYPTETTLCQTSHSGATGYCTEFSNGNCSSSSNYTNKVYAYQISKTPGDDKCYRLSKEDGGPPTWSLLNEDNPSEGVVIIYDGGDYCSRSLKNRQFRLRLECENNYYNIPDSESIVEESCTYNLTLKSIYGCPTKCGISSNALCGDQGECGYDWSNKYPKCFCYYGYTGYACSDVDTNNKTKPTYKQINDAASNYSHTFTYTQTLKNNGWTKDINMSITYDLTTFHLTNDKYYTVRDSSNEYYYYWQFMGNVPSSILPAICENAISSCNYETNPNCTNLPTLGSSLIGTVFQIDNSSSKCQLLGQQSNVTWSLLDEDNPVKGVSITYYDGGYCSPHKSNRQFTIEFECPDSTHRYFNIEEEMDITSYVEEDDDHACQYTLHIITALACPYQCITSEGSNEEEEGSTNEIDSANYKINFTVCSAHGVCGSDPNVNFTHCLCDDGWEGDYCQTVSISSTSVPLSTKKDDHTGFQIAIGIILFFLILLIIISLYLYMRNRSLRKFQENILEAEADAVTQPHNNFGNSADKAAPVRVPDRDYSDSEEDNHDHQDDKHNDNDNNNNNNEDDANETGMTVHNIELTDNNNNNTKVTDGNAV